VPARKAITNSESYRYLGCFALLEQARVIRDTSDIPSANDQLKALWAIEEKHRRKIAIDITALSPIESAAQF